MINIFEKETKLRLKEVNKNEFYEISGKSVKYIANKIKEFNIKHDTRITYRDDTRRDVTIIYFDKCYI